MRASQPKILDELTKDERSLLLYLENRVVDNRGLVDQKRMNDADRAIAERWAADGFIRYGRLPRRALQELGNQGVFHLTFWCGLSAEAWRLAHEERQARAARMWEARQWLTTTE